MKFVGGGGGGGFPPEPSKQPQVPYEQGRLVGDDGHIVWGEVEKDKESSSSNAGSYCSKQQQHVQTVQHLRSGGALHSDSSVASVDEQDDPKHRLSDHEMPMAHYSADPAYHAWSADQQRGGPDRGPVGHGFPDMRPAGPRSPYPSGELSPVMRHHPVQPGVPMEGEALNLRVEQVLSNVGLWSQGSRAHFHGSCKPCHYIHTSAGCKENLRCPYCHIPHTDARMAKGKLCISKRVHCKMVVSALMDCPGTSLNEVRSLAAVVCNRSAYTQTILEERLRSCGEISDVHGYPPPSVPSAGEHMFAQIAGPGGGQLPAPGGGNFKAQRRRERLKKVESL